MQLIYVEHFDDFKTVRDNCERINVKDFSSQEFIDKYESKYKPVVIQGVQDNWKAKHKWSLEVSYTFFELTKTCFIMYTS